MKYVRLENNRVAEILPPETYGNIAYWYNAEFAAKCVQAPDDVECGMVYEDGEFKPAPPMPPAPPDPLEQLRLDMYSRIAEVGYELALLKIGGGRDVV